MRKSYTYRSQAPPFQKMEPEGVCGFHQCTESCYDRTIILFRSRSLREKNQSLHTGIGTFTDGFSEEDDEERRIPRRTNGASRYRMDCLRHYSRYWYQMRSLIRLIVAHYTLYNIVKAGSIRKNTSRLSYFIWL